jgi:hypothetical protein
LQPKPKAKPAFSLARSHQKVLADAQTPEQRREVIRQHVERVELVNDQIVIALKPDNAPDDSGTAATYCLNQQSDQDNMYPGFFVRRKLA